MPRIIGGEFRSRKLYPPPDDRITRPYTDRVKESVFNLLRGWCEGARVLDLFAGIGSMGLEAVSRGASAVVMVESQRKMHQVLERNIEQLGVTDRARAVLGDALSPAALAQAPRPVDLVFVDPPYELMMKQDSRTKVMTQMERCRAIMGDRGFLVLRVPNDPTKDEGFALPSFDGPEVHKYSAAMWVLLYAPRPRATLRD